MAARLHDGGAGGDDAVSGEQRLIRRAIGVLFVVVVLLVASAMSTAGCGRADRRQRSPGAGQAPEATAPKTTLVVYRSRIAPDGSEDRVVPVEVTARLREDTVEARVEAAVAALWTEPRPEERSLGLTSQALAAPGVRLLGVRWERPYVTLNFSRELDRMPGVLAATLFLDELTYTLASLSGVKAVVVQIEGEQVGTPQHPFTGDGILFGERGVLYPSPWPASPGGRAWGDFVAKLAPADALDLFIASIPDRRAMWSLLGPTARAKAGSPAGIDASGFAEGLGAWRGYRVQERVTGDVAMVTLSGDVVREGQRERDATYRARMVRVDGYWHWDLPGES
ncbi:MAG: GerMN domain-containing protein [Clostridia bacterium]|nr:GerMN domain-containing protein [Clostridia bacterium]